METSEILEHLFSKTKAIAEAENLPQCPTCYFGLMRKTSVSVEMLSPKGLVLIPDIDCEECDYCGNKSFDKKARQYIDHAINKD